MNKLKQPFHAVILAGFAKPNQIVTSRTTILKYSRHCGCGSLMLECNHARFALEIEQSYS